MSPYLAVRSGEFLSNINFRLETNMKKAPDHLSASGDEEKQLC